MSDASLVGRQVSYEQRMFWRNPGASIFTFVFPIMFLLIFATLFGNDVQISELSKVKSIQFYVPGLIAFGIISACFTSLAISLTLRRDAGMLKRKRGTPLPAWALIGGLVGSSIIVGLIIAAVVFALGKLLYGLRMPAAHLPALMLTLVLGAIAFCVFGIAVSSLIPNGDAAPAITNAVIFPLLFISNVFVPNNVKWLHRVADLFPVSHFAHATFVAFNAKPGASSFAGTDLAVMGLWAVAGAVAAVRLFRWEPTHN